MVIKNNEVIKKIVERYLVLGPHKLLCWKTFFFLFLNSCYKFTSVQEFSHQHGEIVWKTTHMPNMKTLSKHHRHWAFLSKLVYFITKRIFQSSEIVKN